MNRYQGGNFRRRPGSQQRRREQNNGVIEDFKKFLQNFNCFGDIAGENLRELLKPQGYADRLAEFLKNHTRGIKSTQLRKFFNEIKSATQKAKTNLNDAKATLWRIYPIIAYSEARDLMPREFGDIMRLVLEKVESCSEEERLKKSFERLNDFITALYAYFRKYAGG